MTKQHAVWWQPLHICAQSGARLGMLHTPHGSFQTPLFMPVGTQATVKAAAPQELSAVGAEIILSNTYHLFLRPGADVIQEAGGLHTFMQWPGGVLTDSGGFQVFSLSGLRKITDEGVTFQSHIDGAKKFLSPETATAVQHQLGADIIMAFDECSPGDADRATVTRAMERTHLWAQRCLAAHAGQESVQSLFGIIQGGVFADLRVESAKAIAALDFAGIAVGGLSVGEPKPDMYAMLDALRPHLPANKVHYLMGVGSPDCLMEGMLRGIDIFDCVMPTRTARMGTVWTRNGRINLLNAQYTRDFTPIDPTCDCPACSGFTRAYLRHLFRAKEILAARLATLHNLRFLFRLMEGCREAIAQDRAGDYARDFLAEWQG